MIHKTFFKKVIISSLAFSSLSFVSSAAASTYNYYSGDNVTDPSILSNVDTLNLYSISQNGHNAGAISTGANIYGPGILNTYTGSGGNNITFVSPIGLDGVGSQSPLSLISLIAGNGAAANGDSITIGNPIAANQYIITAGQGGNGGSNAGAAGGSIMFNQTVNAGSGGMNLIQGAGGNGGSAVTGAKAGGAGGTISFNNSVLSSGNINIQQSSKGVQGSNNGGAGGNAGAITYGSDITFTNSAQMNVTGPQNGTAGILNIFGNLTGTPSLPVLTATNNANILIGDGSSIVTVTGRVQGDHTSKLTSQGAIFTDNVSFTDNNLFGNIILSDGTYSTFQGNLAGNVTFGDGTANTSSTIFFQDNPSLSSPPATNFSGKMTGNGTLYTTNSSAVFTGSLGTFIAPLNFTGVGYSIDGNNNISASPSQISFTNEVNTDSLTSLNSSLLFTNLILRATNVALLNTNITLVANNNNVLSFGTIGTQKLYILDGLSSSDVNNFLGSSGFTAPSTSTSSITIKGTTNATLPILTITSASSNQSTAYAIDTITLGTTGDSVSVIVPDGLSATTLNLGTTGSFNIQPSSLLPGVNNDLVLNVNASNNTLSVVKLTIDQTKGNSATINFGTNKLKASTIILNANLPTGITAGISSITLKGNININTKFDGTSCGGIIIDGQGSAINAQSGSNLNINLDANFKPYTAPTSISLFQATNNAQIVAGTGSTGVLAQTINSNTLLPIIWTYDNNTYSLIASGGPPLQLPSNTPVNVIAVYNSIIIPQGGSSKLNSAQINAATQLGSSGNVKDTITAIAAMVINNDTDQNSLDVINTHNTTLQSHLSPITDYLGTDPSKFTQNNEGASAGSNYDRVVGLWISGFIQKVKQKQYLHTPSYRAFSRGGTLGVDKTISDKTLIGLAWNYANSVMKQNNSPIKSRTIIGSNNFSLYGLTSLSNNWFLQGNILYGFSNIRKTATRFDAGIIQPAKAKYKSHTCGSNIQFIKKIEVGSVLLEPTGGLSYNRFHDNSYKEYDGAQNWSSKARNSYNIESLLGGRAIYSIRGTNDWIFRPYISAYSYMTVKDKKGKIHSSIDNLINVSFQSTKASPVWYSTGAGIYAYKGDGFEIAATWEGQFDKKYLGNIGTLKVRVEF